MGCGRRCIADGGRRLGSRRRRGPRSSVDSLQRRRGHGDAGVPLPTACLCQFARRRRLQRRHLLVGILYLAGEHSGLPRGRRELCGSCGPRRRVQRRRARWCCLDECLWVLAVGSRRTQSVSTRLRCRCEPRDSTLSAPAVRLRRRGVARLLRRRPVRGGGVRLAEEVPLLRWLRVHRRCVWIHRHAAPAGHAAVMGPIDTHAISAALSSAEIVMPMVASGSRMSRMTTSRATGANCMGASHPSA